MARLRNRSDDPPITARLGEMTLLWQVALATALPLAVILLYPREATVTAGATLLGMGIGFALERRYLGFETDGPTWQRALRYALGILGMLILYAGLKAAFAALQSVLVWRFIRYALMGLWGSLGAPWAFTKVGLASRQSSPQL